MSFSLTRFIKYSLAALLVAYAIFYLRSAGHRSLQNSSPKINTEVSRTVPNHVFIMTGELSGDKLGSWYLNKLRRQNPHVTCSAIGHTFLAKAGATLLKNILQLESEFHIIPSPLKLLSSLPSCRRLLNCVATYMKEHNCDALVLVDYPWINIPLARKIKKMFPSIPITYIAPPELWFWGRWGIDTIIKSYCDTIIVLYPHEVSWYKKIGLTVQWLGYPFYDEFRPYLKRSLSKKPRIALLPGSRTSECTIMVPLLAECVKELHELYPELSFIIPRAESICRDTLEYALKKEGIDQLVNIIDDEEEKKRMLAECFLAITKPGTITLHLALLNVPSIVTYRVSWLNYLAIRFLVNPSFVSLPNLMESTAIFKELLQSHCTCKAILQEVKVLYTSFRDNTDLYRHKLAQLREFQGKFDTEWHL